MFTKQVIIIEHRYLIRAGLEHFLAEIHGLRIVKLFEGNEKKIVEKIKEKNPDILLINPHSVGESLVRILNSLGKRTTTIGLIGSSTNSNISSHFHSIIHQNDDKQTMQKIMMGSLDTTGKKRSFKKALTSRETTILKYIVRGYTNQKIADELFLSIHTVMTHRKNITRKLGIKTVSGLTVYALLNKLVTLPQSQK